MNARTRKGYSQTYMAHSLGISQKAYSYLESGHCKLDILKFLKIADITEMHPMHFIMKISEGAPSWENTELKKDTQNQEIERLQEQLTFLKSENSFLKSTINKILDK